MQDRPRLISEFWDRSKFLTTKNNHYRSFVNNFLEILLAQDKSSYDMTTKTLIRKKTDISAAIVAKEKGILAGSEEFKLLNDEVKIKFLKNDGDKIKKNERIVAVKGEARKILCKERISLNLLQRMSGIATFTNVLSKKLESVKIAATRKTLWGLIDKKAVSVGNGLTHRLDLNDGILIKDNHLKILSHDVKNALELAQKHKHIEIEVETRKHALLAADTIKKLGMKNKNLFAIMFDKINPREIKNLINYFKKNDLYSHILFEASGNIGPESVSAYKSCGVDVISMGCLTNSAKPVNMSMEIE